MRKLIQNGRPQYGVVDAPWQLINHQDFDYRSPMGKPISGLKKRLAYNHFQYFGVLSDDLLFGCAMVKMRLGFIYFCYTYHTQTKALNEWHFKDIGGFFSSVSDSPTTGKSTFKRGHTLIEFENNEAQQARRLRVHIPESHRMGGLDIDVSFQEKDVDPMCLTTQTGTNGWVYAQKFAGIPCFGTVVDASGAFDMGQLNAYAHHDWSGGFMRRETFWNWACTSGQVRDARGHTVDVGLNLSCGVNETGFTENCFWLDGKLIKVDSIRFDYDRDDENSLWRIASYDGQIDLVFTPHGLHREKQNYLLVASNFKQFFGLFQGRIGDLQIDALWGFVEDQYSKW
ncbi:conserved hypothetical protein [gamma proteobacterium HTCC5015]|nr:conserved hypothetical protein [gamma proteobacterium HTCC5015]